MGIFDNEVQLFTTYAAEIVIRDRIVGGVPKNPKIIEGWLRTKMSDNAQEAEIVEMTLRTLRELGYEPTEKAALDDLEQISQNIASEKQTTGFKVGDRGLYVEARQVKAMLKEATNILFEGEKWGIRKTKDREGNDKSIGGKIAKNFLAERVFVDPDQIWLGVKEPTGVDTFIGHIMTRNGPQSTLAYYEYVRKPTLHFEVKVAKDVISDKQWGLIWVQAQDIGLGAMRSQSFGRFDITKWEKIA